MKLIEAMAEVYRRTGENPIITKKRMKKAQFAIPIDLDAEVLPGHEEDFIQAITHIFKQLEEFSPKEIKKLKAIIQRKVEDVHKKN